MKRVPTRLAGCLLIVAAVAMAAVPGNFTEQTIPQIPNVFNNNESNFQNETHFLNFIQLGSAESATTAAAYYNAVDPTASKRSFPQWLVNAGFISDPSQWHPTGPQKVACDLPGCDLPSRDSSGNLTYGDNIINTDSHAILLNAADLGFVRNQYIRCNPAPCDFTNPKTQLFTYLENYPVNPFAASGNGGSGFPILTGIPSQAEATAAINSALNRPLGKLGLPCVDKEVSNKTGMPVTTDTVLGCKIDRIADVAFEWTPAPTGTSSTLYGKLYAYIFSTDGSNIGDQVHTRETITVPPTGFAPNLADGNHFVPNYPTQGLTAIQATDSFPPNLDFIGFKQHPGVCFICHGGAPQALVNGVYPNQGNVNGFRMLPLDIRNLMFTSDAGGDQPGTPTTLAFTDRLNQEAQIKEYNRAVLQTVTTKVESDGTGAVRPVHLREAITGWYTDPGMPPFNRTTQNGDFLPVGWREPADGGTARAGSRDLYKQVVGPSCRSCHFNREISLDFGTAANFAHEPDDIFGFAIRAQCQQANPPKGKKYMPLAHLTYQRLWQANPTTGGHPGILILGAGSPDPVTVVDPVERLSHYFGYASTAAWCAKMN